MPQPGTGVRTCATCAFVRSCAPEASGLAASRADPIDMVPPGLPKACWRQLSLLLRLYGYAQPTAWRNPVVQLTGPAIDVDQSARYCVVR